MTRKRKLVIALGVILLIPPIAFFSFENPAVHHEKGQNPGISWGWENDSCWRVVAVIPEWHGHGFHVWQESVLPWEDVRIISVQGEVVPHRQTGPVRDGQLVCSSEEWLETQFRCEFPLWEEWRTECRWGL